MDEGGEVVTDWMGPNPTGIFIYDRTGHVSVQLANGDDNSNRSSMPRFLTLKQSKINAREKID